MNVSVTEFKAQCTRILREIPARGEAVRITNRGKVIAVVEPPFCPGADLPAWGALRGSVRRVAADFDVPMGDTDWEAAR